MKLKKIIIKPYLRPTSPNARTRYYCRHNICNLVISIILEN